MDWPDAVLPLVGVVLGGLLTGGTQVWLEHRKEERTQRRARQLISTELYHSSLILGAFAGTLPSTWVTFPDASAILPESAWRDHHADLVGILTPELRDRLIAAYALLDVDRVRIALMNELGPERVASPELIEEFKTLSVELLALRNEIEPRTVVKKT